MNGLRHHVTRNNLSVTFNKEAVVCQLPTLYVYNWCSTLTSNMPSPLPGSDMTEIADIPFKRNCDFLKRRIICRMSPAESSPATEKNKRRHPSVLAFSNK